MIIMVYHNNDPVVYHYFHFDIPCFPQALNHLGLCVVLDVVYNHLHGNGPFDDNSVLDKVRNFNLFSFRFPVYFIGGFSVFSGILFLCR